MAKVIRKKKKSSWHQLKDDRCPKCGASLMKDLFGADLTGCACGFSLHTDTKNLLVKRDNDE